MSELSNDLNKMANLIDQRGLWQVNIKDPGDSLCVITAKVRARVSSDNVYDAIESHLGVSSLRGVEEWNDTPGRTKEEVVTMLRNCAQENK